MPRIVKPFQFSTFSRIIMLLLACLIVVVVVCLLVFMFRMDVQTTQQRALETSAYAPGFLLYLK